MKPSDLLQYVGAALIVGLILLLLSTQLIGQPFIVFVETGSMAPTLEPNDGFLAVPAVVAGEVEVGDVILFQSQELGGGELTTHRVVDITDEGYITQGDANPFTDQSSDEPPVSEGQIRSVALQVGGEIVSIPGLGASVGVIRSGGQLFQETVLAPLGIDTEVTTLSTAALMMGLVLFVYGTVTGSTDRHARSRSRGGLLGNAAVVIAILVLIVIIPINFSMLLPSGVYQYEIISSEAPNANEQIIEVGGTGDVTYAMRNSGHLPVVVFLEAASSGVTVNEPRIYVPRRTTRETSITMQAPDQTGSYLRFVREYRYLVLLPPSLIASLHAIHPIVAIAAINFVVGGVLVAVSVGTVGTGRLRLRSRNRELEIGDSIRRMLPSILLGDPGPKPPDGPPRSVRRGSTRRSTGSTRQPSPPTPTGSSPATPGGSSPPPGSSSTPTPDEQPSPASDDPADDFLSDSDRIEVRDTLQDSPTAVGLDAETWTPQLLQQYLADSYDTDYPLNRCVKLLTSARGVPDDESAGTAGQATDDSAVGEPTPDDATQSTDSDTSFDDIDTAAAADEWAGTGFGPADAADEEDSADAWADSEFTESEYLADSELVEMYQTLQVPPEKIGVDAESWTPETIQQYIADTYDVEYPLDRCQRLASRGASGEESERS